MTLLVLSGCQKEASQVERVDFSELVVDTVCPLFKNYDKPSCHISVRLAEPAETTPDELRRALLGFVAGLPQESELDETAEGFEQMARSYVRDYVMDYLKEGPNAIDNYGDDMEAAATWMSYEETVEGRVLYDDKGIVSYQLRTYSYTGGAHGNTDTQNGVFDLQTLQPVTLHSLFSEASLHAVGDKMRQRLVEEYACSSTDELETKGLFFDLNELEPNDNFVVTDDSIIWMFDPYEIAPFSTGEVHISLPWTEMQSLLLSDAPVRGMLEI